LQHLLTYMFIFHYRGLCCPVCCYEWFCWLALLVP
jgi:hypothetical protein